MSWEEILKGFDRKQLQDAYKGYLDCVKDKELKKIQDKEFETAIKEQLEESDEDEL